MTQTRLTQRAHHYRNVGNTWFYRGLAALFLAISAALIVLSIVNPHTGYSNHLTTQDWLLIIGMCLLAICLLLYSRAAVIVRPASDKFIVRNMFRSYEVRWTSVRRFAPGTFRSVVTKGYRDAVVVAELNDGTRLNCLGLNGVKRRARWVDELNRELANHRPTEAAD